MTPHDGEAAPSGHDSARLAPSPKQPPHSMETEQSVLGGLMLNNRAWLDVSDRLCAEDFYTQDHRVIFEALAELLDAGKPCDFVTVSEFLRQKNKLDDAGGVSYLGTLAADTPSASNVKAYAEIVRDRSVLRSLIAAGQDIAELGYQPGGRASADLVNVAEQAITEICTGLQRGQGEPVSISVLVDAVEDRIERMRADPDAFAGIPMGFTELDRMIGGMQAGDLIIIGGRPGMGKTTLAMNIAEYVSIERKVPALVFSMEMSGEQLTNRILCSVGRIDMERMKSGQLEDQEWSRLVSAGGVVRESPLKIDEAGGLSIADIRSRARRAKIKHKIGLIVLDYIQLMSSPGSKEGRTNDVSAISRGLKALAKELKLPIIAISQLSRKCEERVDKRPQMADLRESGGIEQDADLILFTYRDEYYNPETNAAGIGEVIIAKQRSGRTGRTKLAFLGHYNRFDNLAPGYVYSDTGPAPRKSRGFAAGKAAPHWSERDAA